MGYKVNFDALNSMYCLIANQSGKWEEELNLVEMSVKALLQTSNMTGATADNIKIYLESVHLTLIQILRTLVSKHSSGCLLYKDDYHTNIDTDLHAVIHETEINDCITKLQGTNGTAINIQNEINNVLSGVSEYFSVSYSDITSVDEKQRDIKGWLDALNEDITGLENRHTNNDFIATSEMIRSIKEFINDQLFTTREYKTDFTIDILASSKSLENLYNSYVSICDEIEKESSAIEAAIENENQRVAALQEEYEERQKTANNINILMTGVCVLGSAALIFFTGGAATPVAMGLISAGSGMLMAGTENLTAQYVQHGNLFENADKINWASFATDVSLAGFVGFITGASGQALGNKITSFLGKTNIGSTLLQSSNQYMRIGTNAAIGSISEVTSGVATRFAGEFVTSKGDVNAAAQSAFNLRDILFDAAFGGISQARQGEKIYKAQNAVDTAASSYNKQWKAFEGAEKRGLKNIKETKNGSIDFSESDYILRNSSQEPLQAKVKLTGNRKEDRAKVMEFLKEQEPDIDFDTVCGKNGDYDIFALDDFDVRTGEATFQLVDREALLCVKGHASSAQQYHTFKGEGYQKEHIGSQFDMRDNTIFVKESVDGVFDLNEYIIDSTAKLNMLKNGIEGAQTVNTSSTNVDIPVFELLKQM